MSIVLFYSAFLGAANRLRRLNLKTVHSALKWFTEESVVHEPAKEPNDLERFFVERANAADVEGLVALYESNAVLADGHGEVAIGQKQIRAFFVRFLANRPQFDPSIQAAALYSGDLALTSSRLSNGDITAEIARRQPDGTWLWVVDQFALGKETAHAH